MEEREAGEDKRFFPCTWNGIAVILSDEQKSV